MARRSIDGEHVSLENEENLWKFDLMHVKDIDYLIPCLVQWICEYDDDGTIYHEVFDVEHILLIKGDSTLYITPSYESDEIIIKSRLSYRFIKR